MGMLGVAGRVALTKTGTSGPDVTPNAVNWADVTSGNQATTSMQQFTGINQTITLSISWTASGGGQFFYSKNTTNTYDTGTQVSLTSSPTSLTISNGDYLGFRLNWVSTDNDVRNVTVTNTSDGNATLDTFRLEAFFDI